MDLIHQDPNIEKQYLKRLLKHKKYESKSIYILKLKNDRSEVQVTKKMAASRKKLDNIKL